MTFNTKALNNELNPVWAQSFHWTLPRWCELESATCQMHLYDRSIGKNDRLLGSANVEPLST